MTQGKTKHTRLDRILTRLFNQRNFGILSILGFSCTILGTWEGLLG